MKSALLVFVLFATTARAFAGDTVGISSPSGNIRLDVWQDGQLRYRVSLKGASVLAPSSIDIQLQDGQALSLNNVIRKHLIRAVDSLILSPVPEKRRVIPDRYNELSLVFRQPYKVIFRVYDDGVAYRIALSFKDSVTIQKETAEFVFPGSPSIYFPQINKRADVDIFHTSFEELYPLQRMDSLGQASLAYSPVLVVPAGGSAESGGVEGGVASVGITESDLEDYPGMFLQGTGSSALRGVFAGYPLEERVNPGDYPQVVVARRAGYLARTVGTRQLPWRVLVIAAEDRDLPVNDLVYRLASPSRVKDPSWIHPGKGTDEWIINTNLFNIPFKSGVNTATYKFYIDFASRFGFNRIMMDAGWSDNSDLFKMNPAINMDTIAAYAASKGVKLSMWTLAITLDRQLEGALEQFNKWGVDFIMTDFIDRDDQKMVNFYHRMARACADHKIMIMYHGAYPPKGFNRTWPNAITREGVLGSEYNIWSDKATPGHDLILPFTRMLAGSFDYEPGFLNNATKAGFRSIEGNPMSQGTRCHQLAMFVVYDNPMQIFSGNPSEGLREPAFMELLGSLPTVWDTTLVLDAKVARHIVTVRRKGNEWFVAGMTDWTARDIDVALSFLGAGKYTMTLCKDGINADKYAADYELSEAEVDRATVLPVHLAPGGGFLLRLRRVQGTPL